MSTKETNLTANYIAPNDLEKLEQLQKAVVSWTADEIFTLLEDKSIKKLNETAGNDDTQLGHWTSHDIIKQAEKFLLTIKELTKNKNHETEELNKSIEKLTNKKNNEAKKNIIELQNNIIELEKNNNELINMVKNNVSRKITSALTWIKNIWPLINHYDISDKIKTDLLGTKEKRKIWIDERKREKIISTVKYEWNNTITFDEQYIKISGEYLVNHVLKNLIDNAREKWNATDITIKIQKQEWKLIIEVIDNWTWINESVLKDLWNKKIKSTETGWGWVFILQATHQMKGAGGTLTFKNNENGKGSTATITIPQPKHWHSWIVSVKKRPV